MSDLSGLELRKAALEVLGWRLFFVGNGYLYHQVIPPSVPPFQMDPDQARLWEEVSFNQISEKDLAKSPSIESDPAVSEPMFLEWCVANKYDSAMETCFDGRPSCRVFNRLTPAGQPVEQIALAFGDTLSEARALCIVVLKGRV